MASPIRDSDAELAGQKLYDSGQPVAAKKGAHRKAILAILTCWLLVVFDGYDLIVYGTVQPSLLAMDDWGLTPIIHGNHRFSCICRHDDWRAWRRTPRRRAGATPHHFGLCHYFLHPDHLVHLRAEPCGFWAAASAVGYRLEWTGSVRERDSR